MRRSHVTLLGLLSLAVVASPALANPSFGMIGIASGETLRLNVIAFPTGPCRAQLRFINGAGVQVGPATTVSLAAGQGAPPLDFYPSSPVIPSGQRMEVRPVVSVISTADTASQCLATSEVLDNTTGDSLVEFAAGAPIAPGATQTFGLHGVGAADSQKLRLNVVAFPGVCHAQMTFHVISGYVGPIPSTTVSLAPGQASFIDFNPGLDTLPIAPGERLEVLPVVTPQDSVSTCTASAEVIEPTTATTRASATPPTNSAQPSFGMIGIAANQTLQVNVKAYPSNPITPAPPCVGQMGFFDGAGIQVGPSSAFSLSPGQSAPPLQYFPSNPIIPPGQRMEVRPEVILSSGSQCLATAEAFDNASGASEVEVPATAPAQLGVAPSYGIHGVAGGQLLRLNVSAFPVSPIFPTGPCRATISFTSPATGQTIGPAPLSVDLAPGQSAFLDFHPGALGVAPDQRIEVHPVIALEPSPASSACTATAEVWELSSGRTVAWTHKTTPALRCPGEPDFEEGKNPDDSCRGEDE